MNSGSSYATLRSFGPLVIGDMQIPLPLVQGGMGVGISLAGLASAVANAGGIGVISAASIQNTPRYLGKKISSSEAIRQEIRLARSLTDGALGVNIMVALHDFALLCQVAAEENIDFIFAGAGLPLKLPEYIPEGSTTKLVPIVSSGKAAALISRWWQQKYSRSPDAFVLEGPLAGGHLGFKPEQINDPAFRLEALLPDVLKEASTISKMAGRTIPVIVAGGIYSGADVLSFLSQGADAVQMATRFVGTHECDAPLAFKQGYLDCEPEDIVIINSPVGMPGRAILNPFVTSVERGETHPLQCHYHCIITCKRDQSPYCIADALLLSLSGNTTDGLLFAGANAWKLDRICSVSELIADLDAEMVQAQSKYQIINSEKMRTS